MKFDVVLGNPPYQSPNKKDRNIGAPLWPQFIEKAFKVSDVVAMVTPSTWMSKASRGAWKTLSRVNLIFVETNAKKYFPNVGGNGGTFSYFIAKNEEYSGKTQLSCGIELDFHREQLPFNTTQITEDNILFVKENLLKTLNLIVKCGPSNPSINSDHWSEIKTKQHVYETYYSGQQKRRSMWCDQQIGDYGKLKLVVATSGNIYNSMEITTKGVGRQGNYVLGTQEELEHIKNMLLSDRSKKLNMLMQEGNFNTALKYVVNEKQGGIE